MKKYKMTSVEKEQIREFTFFVFMNKATSLSHLRTSSPEIIEKILEKIIKDISSEVLGMDVDNYILDVYGRDLYNKHKQQWESHKLNMKMIKQIRTSINSVCKKKDWAFLSS